MSLTDLNNLSNALNAAKDEASASIGTVLINALTDKYTSAVLTDNLYTDAVITNGVLDDIITSLNSIQSILVDNTNGDTVYVDAVINGQGVIVNPGTRYSLYDTIQAKVQGVNVSNSFRIFVSAIDANGGVTEISPGHSLNLLTTDLTVPWFINSITYEVLRNTHIPDIIDNPPSASIGISDRTASIIDGGSGFIGMESLFIDNGALINKEWEPNIIEIGYVTRTDVNGGISEVTLFTNIIPSNLNGMCVNVTPGYSYATTVYDGHYVTLVPSNLT